MDTYQEKIARIFQITTESVKIVEGVGKEWNKIPPEISFYQNHMKLDNFKALII